MIRNTREALSRPKIAVALVTFSALCLWLFFRVRDIGPAILGDEYLYSMNSRKGSPWAEPVAGDFSNYLFNLVYSSTNLCGDAFYSCVKGLNIMFFMGFIVLIFLIASRFLGFWPSLGFSTLAGISPVHIYVSMFLPESMFFLGVACVLWLTLAAMNRSTPISWASVGIAVGVTSLIKPHAWITAIAVAITIFVVCLGEAGPKLKLSTLRIASFLGAATVTRVLIGIAIAGPKAVDFFGLYLGRGTVETVLAGPAGDSEQAGPLSGALDLFPGMFLIHLQSAFALMGISIVGLVVGLLDVFKTKRLTEQNSLALFSFIWLLTLMLAIVLFTGWITGGGDDHSSRVLFRYYDFLFVIVPLAALVTFSRNAAGFSEIGAVPRWFLALAGGFVATNSFTGFFEPLTIQIADAPNLAGLVVNLDVYNGVAIVGFLAYLLFATFPRFVPWIYIAMLPLTFAATGWHTHNQYDLARGFPSPADAAGKQLSAEFSDDSLDQTLVLATSRFDGTNVAFWADSRHLEIRYLPFGAEIPVEWLVDKQIVLTLAGSPIPLGFQSYDSSESYSIYVVED